MSVVALDNDGRAVSTAAFEVIGEGLTANVDASGRAQLTTIRIAGRKGLRISAPGYETMFRSVDLRPGYPHEVDVRLRAVPPPHHVTLPALGEQVSVEEGPAQLTISGGGLVRPDGTEATGEVDVFLVPYDPVSGEDPPSSMQTVDGRPLISLGMSSITIKQDDVELQPKAGMPLGWSMAVNSRLAPFTDPSSYKIYFVDESKALWREEPGATLAVSSDSGLRLTAQLPHLSVWNFDNAFEVGGCILGQIHDGHHQLVSDPSVVVNGVDVSTGSSIDGSSTSAYMTSSHLNVSSPQYLGTNPYNHNDGTTYPITVPPSAFFIQVPKLDPLFSLYNQLVQMYGLVTLPMQITVANVSLSGQNLHSVTIDGASAPTSLTQGPITPPSYGCKNVQFQYCIATGQTCSSGDLCCNGQTCSGGTCGGVAAVSDGSVPRDMSPTPDLACRGSGSVCQDPSDCCSGSCTDKTCL